MKVLIKGIGLLGGFGKGLTDLEKSVRRRSPKVASVTMDSAGGKIRVPALLADTSDLASFVRARALRRLDHYIRMALLGGYYALDDAGMLESGRRRLGIIVATGYGATCNTFDFQNSMITAADPCGSPTKFSNSVHNAAAGNISILLNETGPNLSVSHHDMSFASALLTAVHWLDEGRVDTVLIGGVDEYCKVLGYYWHFCNTDSGENISGDESADSRHPAIIGEGACFFVLTTDAADSSSYGCIETVETGNHLHRQVKLPENAVYFLGADGSSRHEDQYAEIVPTGAAAAVYTPVYGGIPVGHAFDLALAALSLKRRTLYGSLANPVGNRNQLNLIKKNAILDAERICCLKLGAGGSYGSIVLNGHPAAPAV